MAFDKVVDSSVLDAGLKQIADAIREKGGTSDNLAFPAAMADAIAAIEAGGGGVLFKTGTITPAAETTTLTIQHELGKTPTLLMAYVTPSYSGTANKTLLSGYGLYFKSPELINILLAGGRSITATSAVNHPAFSTSSTSTTLESTAAFITKQHTWIAIG